MSRNGCAYVGKILPIRAVEDSIRVTKKYTKGVFRKSIKHPIQGEEFPSKVINEYYEVYPFVDVRGGAFWDLPVGVALDWLWGDTPCIKVVFNYDYRSNIASILIEDGIKAVQLLAETIPKFSDTLARVIADEAEVKIGESGKTNTP